MSSRTSYRHWYWLIKKNLKNSWLRRNHKKIKRRGYLNHFRIVIRRAILIWATSVNMIKWIMIRVLNTTNNLMHNKKEFDWTTQWYLVKLLGMPRARAHCRIRKRRIIPSLTINLCILRKLVTTRIKIFVWRSNHFNWKKVTRIWRVAKLQNLRLHSSLRNPSSTRTILHPQVPPQLRPKIWTTNSKHLRMCKRWPKSKILRQFRTCR